MRLTRLRTNTPEPARSTTASAISKAVSASRIDTRRRPVDRIAAPVSFLRDCATSGRVDCIAGASPNRMPVAIAIAPANANAATFSWIGSTNTVPMPLALCPPHNAGRAAEITLTPMRATMRLATPPANASNTLSTSSWRTMRPREAPIASRTAISRRRPAAPDEKQVRDVGAGDEQHQSHGAEQEEEGPAVAVVDARRVERVRGDTPMPRARPMLRKACVDARADLPRDRRSAFGGHARREAARSRKTYVARRREISRAPMPPAH